MGKHAVPPAGRAAHGAPIIPARRASPGSAATMARRRLVEVGVETLPPCEQVDSFVLPGRQPEGGSGLVPARPLKFDQLQAARAAFHGATPTEMVGCPWQGAVLSGGS